MALVIELTVVRNENHDLGHAGKSRTEETVQLVIALYGIEPQFDAEPRHTHALRCRMKKSVAYGDGVANVAHDVVDPFLGDDFFVADLLAAILSSGLLLQVSSAVSYLLYGGFTGEEMLKLRLAVLVTFFDTVISHRGAELLQCIVV